MDELQTFPPLSLPPATGVKAQCPIQNVPRSLLRPSASPSKR